MVGECVWEGVCFGGLYCRLYLFCISRKEYIIIIIIKDRTGA